MFVITAEAESYEGYCNNNVCLVETREKAEEICEILNAVVIKQRKFQNEDLRAFNTEYRKNNPCPPRPEFQKFPEKHPQLSSELAAITRKQRKGPDYEAYLAAKTIYDKKLASYREEIAEKENAHTEIFKKWHDDLQDSVNKFTESHLNIQEMLPEENRDKLLSYLEFGAACFTCEEVDLF